MRRILGVFFTIATAICLASAQPPLDVTVEPLEEGSVVYSPVAARSTAHQPTGQIALLLKIKNIGTRDLVLNRVVIVYEGPGGPVTEKEITRDGILPLTLPRGTPVYWHQVRDKTHDTVIYLTENFEPNLIIIKLYCEGITGPLLISKAMKKHTSPVAGKSYLFPGRAKDMRDGEYWYTASNHETSLYGSQLFAYDIYAVGWDDKKKDYTKLLPETTGCKNTDHRAYDKPVYSMAEGEVLRFQDGIAENPMPWRLVGDTNKNCPTDAEKTAWNCGSLPPNTGGGNYVMIRSGDEVHAYAHFKAGSLNPRLRQGERINAGVYLGRIGNTGCSTYPHTHVDALQIHDGVTVKTTSNGNHPDIVSLRPLVFHDIFTVQASLLEKRDPEPDKWTKVDDRTIPYQHSFIWAFNKKPCYHVPDLAEISYHAVEFADFQRIFNRTVECGYYPEWVDGYEFNGKSYYNMIFRYDPNRDWIARQKQDLDRFNEHRQELERKGYRLIFVDSYPAGNSTSFSSIYVRDGGSQTKVTPFLLPEVHQQMLDQMTRDGWRPIRVSSLWRGGLRWVTTLYEKRLVGNWQLDSRLTHAQYDTLFDRNGRKGWELVHLDAYTENGSARYAAIWHQNTPYSAVSGAHRLSFDGYQQTFNSQIAQGYLTRVVTGIEVNNKMRFAGAWTK